MGFRLYTMLWLCFKAFMLLVVPYEMTSSKYT